MPHCIQLSSNKSTGASSCTLRPVTGCGDAATRASGAAFRLTRVFSELPSAQLTSAGLSRFARNTGMPYVPQGAVCSSMTSAHACSTSAPTIGGAHFPLADRSCRVPGLWGHHQSARSTSATDAQPRDVGQHPRAFAWRCGAGFQHHLELSSVCVDCLHNESKVRDYLNMSGSSLKVECKQWVNIAGLVLSFSGVLVAVASGCSY